MEGLGGFGSEWLFGGGNCGGDEDRFALGDCQSMLIPSCGLRVVLLAASIVYYFIILRILSTSCVNRNAVIPIQNANQ